MRRVLYFFTAIFFFQILSHNTELFSFGPRGPYTHKRITFDPFDAFSKESGFEINPICMEAIWQGNIQSDAILGDKDVYHCDNNQIQRCSQTFHDLLEETKKIQNHHMGLLNLGKALHILQDFYAHSNWVEITEGAELVAPVEEFRFYPFYGNLQSGSYPLIPIRHDIATSVEDAVDCFLKPKDQWKTFVLGATHSCMAKDSNVDFRGGELPRLGFGKTYHEVAGVIATKHTTQFLVSLFKKRNPTLMQCLLPRTSGLSCAKTIFKTRGEL